MNWKKILFILVLVYYSGGFEAVGEIIKSFTMVTGIVLSSINSFTLSLYDSSIVDILLRTSIVFILAGLILDLFNISKGRSGSIFGKFLFWLIGIPVSIILNFIASFIF